MMRRFGFILICCALISGCISEPYVRVPGGDADLGPGMVDLPPGFTHARDRGIDSYVGHFISADGHLIIQYDIGADSGVYATHPDGEVLSSSEVKVNDSKALIVLVRRNNEKHLIISFPEGSVNFFAKVENDADIETVRKLVLSFRWK
jgi:hypothetical protein